MVEDDILNLKSTENRGVSVFAAWIEGHCYQANRSELTEVCAANQIFGTQESTSPSSRHQAVISARRALLPE